MKVELGKAGKHADTLPPSTVTDMFRLVKAHEIVYLTSISVSKAAVLCFYYRLAATKYLRYTIYTTLFLIFGTNIFGIIAVFANCRPFALLWDGNVHGHCAMSSMSLIRIYSIADITIDSIILLIAAALLVSPLADVGRKAEMTLSILLGIL